MAAPTTRPPGLPADEDRALLRDAAHMIRNTQPVDAHDLHLIADRLDTTRPITAQHGLSAALATAQALAEGRVLPAPEPTPRAAASPRSGTPPRSAVLLAEAALAEHAMELTPRRWAMVLRIRALAHYAAAEEQRRNLPDGVEPTGAFTRVRLLREHADLVEASSDLNAPMPAAIAELASRPRGRTR